MSVSVCRSAGARRAVYWVLLLCLAPLAFALSRPADDVIMRFDQTLQRAPADVRLALARVQANRSATIDDVFVALPGQRLAGAFVSRRTGIHWLFAGLAAALMLGVTLRMFPNSARTPGLFAVGLFTATAGLALLLLVESFVSWGGDFEVSSGITLRVLAMVAMIGLFEELAKLAPLIWRIRRLGPLDWQQACRWGLASGTGFGVAEGVIYAEQFYNGVSAIDAYIVRFISCVVLHAVWTASAALCLCFCGSAIRAVFVPAVLHAIYDLALQYEMDWTALATALVSLGWLVLQLEAFQHAPAFVVAQSPGSRRSSTLDGF